MTYVRDDRPVRQPHHMSDCLSSLLSLSASRWFTKHVPGRRKTSPEDDDFINNLGLDIQTTSGTLVCHGLYPPREKLEQQHFVGLLEFLRGGYVQNKSVIHCCCLVCDVIVMVLVNAFLYLVLLRCTATRLWGVLPCHSSRSNVPCPDPLVCTPTSRALFSAVSQLPADLSLMQRTLYVGVFFQSGNGDSSSHRFSFRLE